MLALQALALAQGWTLGPLAPYPAAAFGLFLGALISSYIVDWAGRTGQRRQWARDWSLRTVEAVYGPLYEEILANNAKASPITIDWGVSSRAWDSLLKSHLNLSIPANLRAELDSYYGLVARWQDSVSAAKKALSWVAKGRHAQALPADRNTNLDQWLDEAIGSFLTREFCQAIPPPAFDPPEGTPWSSYYHQLRVNGAFQQGVDWRALYDAIGRDFRSSEAFQAHRRLAEECQSLGLAALNRLERTIRNPARELGLLD